VNPMFDLNVYIKEKKQLINDALLNIIDMDSTDRVTRAMLHSLMAGGKRLRPILCLAATEAVGGDPANSVCPACALEMIHTYSLIHDDLPAIDDDRLRRGKPTCHVAFDEATAILAGDALLTLAFQVLSSPPSINDLSPLKLLEVIHIISRAAGYQGMIEGQMQDISFEGKQLGLEQLKGLHKLKTGTLIEASIRTGAVLGDGSTQQIEQLGEYAKHIGLAFQVRDDILNVEGDPEVMGKAAGTDIDRGKNTFPALIGIEKSKAFAKKLVSDALQVLENFDTKADPLRAIASYIVDRKK